jgi:hypothetical protein
VLPEATPVEETCDPLVLVVAVCDPFELVVVVAMWPTVDPAKAPPNAKTAKPKPESTAITTATTDFFKPSPQSQKSGGANPLSRFAWRSWGNNYLSSNLEISVVIVAVDAWLREGVAPALILSELT